MQAAVLSALLVRTYGWNGTGAQHATATDPLVVTRHEDKALFGVLTAISRRAQQLRKDISSAILCERSTHPSEML